LSAFPRGRYGTASRGVDVGRKTRDPAAYRVLIEERNIQTPQMPHQLARQIEHGVLSNPLRQVPLAEVAEHRANQRREARRHEVAINRNLGEQRSDHLQRGADRQQDQRYDDLDVVRPDVGRGGSYFGCETIRR
jgi:hypothetical protein